MFLTDQMSFSNMYFIESYLVTISAKLFSILTMISEENMSKVSYIGA